MIDSDSANILGYIGGCIVSLQGVPQILKIWRNRSADDLSYASLFTYIIGGGLIISYGVMIQQPPIYSTVSLSMANTITLAFSKFYLSRSMRQDVSETRDVQCV